MNEIIQSLLQRHQYSDGVTVALRQFAEGNTSRLLLNAIQEEHNLTPEQLRWEAMDVIIDIARLILEDNILTPEEMQTLRLLKLYLGVREGDFIKQHKEEQIKQILSQQLRRIYEDHKVDCEEALMKVDLQELFGLGYDQFLEFEKEAVEQALNNGADIRNLDTYYKS